MLPRVHRLTDQTQILHVIKYGKTISQPTFRLKIYQPSTTSTHPTQACFIVSKKVAKHATDRNRLRRRMRHALAFYLPSLKPNCHLVFVLNLPLLHLPSSQIHHQLRQAITLAQLQTTPLPTQTTP